MPAPRTYSTRATQPATRSPIGWASRLQNQQQAALEKQAEAEHQRRLKEAQRVVETERKAAERAAEERQREQQKIRNAQIETEARRTGRKIYKNEFGDWTPEETDEQFARNQQIAAKNAEKDARYRREGRQFFTDKATGEIQPEIPDDAWTERQQALRQTQSADYAAKDAEEKVRAYQDLQRVRDAQIESEAIAAKKRFMEADKRLDVPAEEKERLREEMKAAQAARDELAISKPARELGNIELEQSVRQTKRDLSRIESDVKAGQSPDWYQSQRSADQRQPQTGESDPVHQVDPETLPLTEVTDLANRSTEEYNAEAAKLKEDESRVQQHFDALQQKLEAVRTENANALAAGAKDIVQVTDKDEQGNDVPAQWSLGHWQQYKKLANEQRELDLRTKSTQEEIAKRAEGLNAKRESVIKLAEVAERKRAEERLARLEKMRRSPGMAPAVDEITRLDADFERVRGQLDPSASEEDRVALEAITAEHDRAVQEALNKGRDASRQLIETLNAERLRIAGEARQENLALLSGPDYGMAEDDSAKQVQEELSQESFRKQVEAGVKLGMEPEDAAALVQDLALSQDNWQGVSGVKEADKTRILSDGRIAVNPSLFVEPAEYKKAVESSDASPEAKAEALEKLPALEEIALNTLLRDLSGAPGFHEFALKNGAEFMDPGVVNLATWTPQEIEAAKAKSNFKTTADLVRAYREGPGKNWFRNQAHQALMGLSSGALAMIQQATGSYGALTGNEGAINIALDAGKAMQKAGAHSRALQHGQWTQKLVQGGTSILPALLGGAVVPRALAMYGAAGAAGLQSGGGTFSDAVQSYMAQGMDMQQARKAALGPTIASGLTTAAITFAFGTTGAESMFAQNEFRETGKELVRSILVHSGLEATEESLDQFMQGVIAQMSYYPDKTFGQIVDEMLEAGALGGVLGGGLSATTNFDRPASSPMQQTADLAASDAELDSFDAGDPQVTAQTVLQAQTLRDIAQGATLDSLTDEQLATVGIERTESGQIKNIKTKDAIPLVKVENGQPIITQGAINMLGQRFPRTRSLIGMSEAEARQRFSQKQAESQASTDAAVSGAEATGKPRGSSTEAVAVPADSGAGLQAEGAVEASPAEAAPAIPANATMEYAGRQYRRRSNGQWVITDDINALPPLIMSDELDAIYQERNGQATVAPTPEGSAKPARKNLEDVEVGGIDDIIQNGGGQLTVTYQGQPVAFKDFAVTVDDGSAEVYKVEVADKTASKGIGTLAYIKLGQALAARGITLTSSKAQFADGRKVWDRLVKLGHAVRTGSGTYEFRATPAEEAAPPWSAKRTETGGVVFRPEGETESQPEQPSIPIEQRLGERVGEILADVTARSGRPAAGKLAVKAKLLVSTLSKTAPNFADVRFESIPDARGPAYLDFDGSLALDVRRTLDVMQGKSVRDAQAWLESMIDEEFRHRVAMDLESKSPEFAQDLSDLYDSLPSSVKELSRAAYHAQLDTKNKKHDFPDTYNARHEFFRQYWSSAKVQKLTESALAQKGMLAKLRSLIARFLKELRRIQKGANPQVKAIADRLIAQAEARAAELAGKGEATAKPDSTPRAEGEESGFATPSFGPPSSAPTLAQGPDGLTLTPKALYAPPIRAYHGTPHKVDKFTTAKMGTGEGNQAFGWGLYFAESADVAEQYKADAAAIPSFEVEQDSDGTWIVWRGASLARRNIPTESEARTLVASLRRQVIDSLGGNLYKVELLTDDAELLDWDLPLSKQSDKVRSAIAKLDPALHASPDLTGKDVYHSQWEKLIRSGKAKPAKEKQEELSRKLAKLGIKGIRFLDGFSRGKSEGTRNFVIFRDEDIRITHENGKELPLKGLSAPPSGPPKKWEDVQPGDALDDVIALIPSDAAALPDGAQGSFEASVEAVEKWLEQQKSARDPRGKSILLANPENGSLRARAEHLLGMKLADGSRSRDRDKARTVFATRKTLAFPHLIAERGKIDIYFRRYADGTAHAVFVDSNGGVLSQKRLENGREVTRFEHFDLGLESQYPPKPGKQFDGAIVVYRRKFPAVPSPGPRTSPPTQTVVNPSPTGTPKTTTEPKKDQGLSAPPTNRDAEHLAAVERGDMEAAQRMVDEASGFDNFYIGTVSNGAVSAQKRPSRLGDHYAMGFPVGSRFRYEPTSKTIFWTNEGVDSFDREAVKEWLARRKLGTAKESFNVTAFARPEILKLRPAAVTRDGQGNVIPLSQRFNEQSNSILYAPPNSPSDEEVAASLQAQEADLDPELTEEEQAALDYFHQFAKPPPVPEKPKAEPAPEPTIPQTSLKNAVVDDERAARGLPPRLRPIAQAWGEAGIAAGEMLLSNPDAGRNLVKEYTNDPRPLRTHEVVLLLMHKVETDHQLERAAKKLIETADDSEENKIAKRDYDIAELERAAIDAVGYDTGTETARSLNIRKQMLQKDMSLANLLMQFRAKVNLGKPLTDEQRRLVTFHADKLAEAQRKIDALEAEAAKKSAEQGLQRLTTDLARPRGKATGVRKFIGDKAAEARERLKALLAPQSLSTAPVGEGGAPPIPQGSADLITHKPPYPGTTKERIAAYAWPRFYAAWTSRLPNPDAPLTPSQRKQLDAEWRENLADENAMEIAADNLFTESRMDGFDWQVYDPAPSQTDEETEQSGGLYAPTSANLIADLATVGAAYIADGVDTVEAFTKLLVSEFGPTVEQYAAETFKAAKKAYASAAAEFEASQKPAGILKTAKDKLKPEPGADLNPRLLTDLATAYIREGINEAEELVTKITKDIQDIYPGATEEQVRTVFSGYGKTSKPTKDELKRKLTEYKTQLRLIQGLADAKAGKSPLKSGFQRGKPSDRVRDLSQQLKSAMRKMGIETTGEEQLASAKKAVINRLKNQIADLDSIIKGKRKPGDERSVVEYDAEMTTLLKERNELKAYVDDLTGPSPELKWNRRAQQAAKASEEYYKRRIAAGDFESKKAPGQTESEATKKAREEAKIAKDEFERLREATGIPAAEALERARTKLESEIAKAQQRLITGEKPALGQKKAQPAELDALRETLSNLRKSIRLVEGGGRRTEAQRAEQAERTVQKQIEELNRRIAAKDTSARAKPLPVEETESLRTLRQERDFLREIYALVREAKNPRRLPEEIALDNFRRRVEKLRHEAELGLSRKEYLEVPRPDPLFQSRRDKASFELSQAKEAWNTELLNARLAAREPLEKILGYGAEALNLSRSILTSVDFSAVLRQGGFIAMGNPVRAAKSLPAMFKAFASPAAQHAVMEEIKRRPNFPLYQQSKLYLTDVAELDLAKMEENYMSRIANKIPIVAGSQRAYITFLNKLRADTFDAMMATLGRDGRVTLEEGRALANFINVATGRGIIGSSKKQQGTPVLSTIFFSPRLLASRFNLLLGQPLYGGSARTRKLVAGEYAKALAGVGVALGLLALFKDDEDDAPLLETNPLSSDFLKARFGNSRVDLFGGLLQATVVLSRLITGETKKKDKIIPIRDSLRPLETIRGIMGKPLVGNNRPFGTPDATQVAWRFLRSKFSPALGAITNLVAGEDFKGEPTNLGTEAIRMTVPMSLTNIQAVMEDQGITGGTALTLLSLFGAGLQTYDSGTPFSTDPKELDEMVKNWNAQNPQEKWSPSASNEYDIKILDPDTGKVKEEKEMTPEQKVVADGLRLKMREDALKNLDRRTIDKPDASAIKAVKSVRSESNARVQQVMRQPDWRKSALQQSGYGKGVPDDAPAWAKRLWKSQQPAASTR